MGATKGAALILDCDGPHSFRDIYNDVDIWTCEKRAREAGWRIGANKALCPKCMGQMKPEQMRLFEEEGE